MTDAIAKAIEARKARMAEIGGCLNHGCVINPPKGMGTNGPCHCLADHLKAKRYAGAERSFVRDVEEALRQPSPAMMPDAPQELLVVKAALEVARDDYMMLATHDTKNIKFHEARMVVMENAIAALSCDAFRNWMGRVVERTLPEIHDGWKIIQLQDDRPKYPTWQVVISNDKCTIADYGPTPRAAVLAALANIKTEG